MKVSEESSADMSVATSHRKEPTEMNVISKAKDVFKHSRLMIKNDNRFPKKERFMLSKDIYEYSRDIVTKLIAANDLILSVSEQREIRLRYQIEAVTVCKNLLFLVEQAYEENYINGDSCAYWSQMIADVKNMTLAWNRKDRQR